MVDSDTLKDLAALINIASGMIAVVKWLYRQMTKPRRRPKHLQRK